MKIFDLHRRPLSTHLAPHHRRPLSTHLAPHHRPVFGFTTTPWLYRPRNCRANFTEVEAGLPGHKHTNEVQNKQEKQGVKEQTGWGRHALEGTNPRAEHLASRLEGHWAGRNGKGNAWNNKLRHLLYEKNLN